MGMSNGHPAKELDRGQPSGDRPRREGDIIVTAVGGHYAIGRLKADGDMQQYLETLPKLAEALRRASVLAGPAHRVFLYPSAGTPYYRLVDCAEIAQLRRIKHW